MPKFLTTMINSPEANTLGMVTTCLAALNSFFEVFNPVITGVFYVISIIWLCVQIYYKLKIKK